ncbi:MAG: hypothetical protein P0Y60_02795 [Candidatus Microbacterium colombiense]|nr:MAG: hypothetical protein P0Y60_02795 [Microbacterium sp.]
MDAAADGILVEHAPSTWFQTTTRPRSRLLATVLVFGFFAVGITLGALVPELRLWLQLPAAVAMVTWYFVMVGIHERVRSGGRATWYGTLTQPLGHLIGTIVVFTWVIGCAIVSSGSARPDLVLAAGIPMILWSLYASVRYHRHRATEESAPSTLPEARPIRLLASGRRSDAGLVEGHTAPNVQHREYATREGGLRVRRVLPLLRCRGERSGRQAHEGEEGPYPRGV